MSAYIVVEVEVSDADAYASYTAQVQECLVPFEGRFIVRGGVVTPLEGAPPAGRVVMLMFPSSVQAHGFWESPGYRAIVPIRQGSSSARIFLIEGVPG